MVNTQAVAFLGNGIQELSLDTDRYG